MLFCVESMANLQNLKCKVEYIYILFRVRFYFDNGNIVYIIHMIFFVNKIEWYDQILSFGNIHVPRYL